MFSFFGIIRRIENNWMSVRTPDGEMINVDKKPINLNIDYSSVEEKFYKWRFSGKKDDVLQYNVEESKVFVELWHIAILKVQSQALEGEGVDVNSMNLVYHNLASYLVQVVFQDQFTEFEGL